MHECQRWFGWAAGSVANTVLRGRAAFREDREVLVTFRRRRRSAAVSVLGIAAFLGSSPTARAAPAPADETSTIDDSGLLECLTAATDPRNKPGSRGTWEDMRALRTLTCNDVEIASLAGIEKLEALVHNTFVNTGISELGPVSDLEGLKSLHITEEAPEISGRAGPSHGCGDGVGDLSQLSGLTDLEKLSVICAPVTDLAPLSGLTRLTELWIADSHVRGLSGLEDLTNLESLTVSSSLVSDIAALEETANLDSLTLSDNEIDDLSPLSGAAGLRNLKIENNRISDVSALAGLTNLETLSLRHNRIVDISELPEVENADVSSQEVHLGDLRDGEIQVGDTVPNPVRDAGGRGVALTGPGGEIVADGEEGLTFGEKGEHTASWDANDGPEPAVTAFDGTLHISVLPRFSTVQIAAAITGAVLVLALAAGGAMFWRRRTD